MSEIPAIPGIPGLNENEPPVIDETNDIPSGSKDMIRDNPPDFIRTEREHHYYVSMYDRIKDNGTVMQTADTYGLGMLAMNLALIDEATHSINKEGMSVTYQGDRKEVTKRNPALDVLKDAQGAVRFYLKEFKMTPNSRGKQLGDGAGGQGESDGFDQV